VAKPGPEAAAELDVEVDLEAAGDDAAESIAAPEVEVVAESEEVAIVEVVAEVEPDPEPPA
jgi:hypothetical protein